MVTQELELGAYAASLLTDARGRVRDTRKLGNNTYARKIENGVAVRLHETDVVTIQDDGVVRLSTGGWDTLTTRDRLNRYAPGVRVWRDRGVTRVGVKGAERVYTFVDPFEYRPETGEVLTSPDLEDDVLEQKRRLNKARRAANAWLTSMTQEEGQALGQALVDGNVAGDCFYCRPTTDGPVLGDALGGHHIVAHLEERYYVPSLFINAFVERYGEERAGRYASAPVYDLVLGRVDSALDSSRVFRKTVVDYVAPRMVREGWNG